MLTVNGTVLASCLVCGKTAHYMCETGFLTTVVDFAPTCRPPWSAIGSLRLPGALSSISSADDVNVTAQSLDPQFLRQCCISTATTVGCCAHVVGVGFLKLKSLSSHSFPKRGVFITRVSIVFLICVWATPQKFTLAVNKVRSLHEFIRYIVCRLRVCSHLSAKHFHKDPVRTFLRLKR